MDVTIFQGKFMYSDVSVFSEHRRELNRERILLGLEAAKKEEFN